MRLSFLPCRPAFLHTDPCKWPPPYSPTGMPNPALDDRPYLRTSCLRSAEDVLTLLSRTLRLSGMRAAIDPPPTRIVELVLRTDFLSRARLLTRSRGD
jgi:hypothetical protein